VDAGEGKAKKRRSSAQQIIDGVGLRQRLIAG